MNEETATIDMGILPEKGESSEPCMPCKGTDDKGPRYPEWTLRDKHAELFLKSYPKVKKGDTFDLGGLMLRVCGWSDTQYDKSITFEVITFPAGAIPEDGEDESETETAPKVEEKPAEPAAAPVKKEKPAKKEATGLAKMIGATES